ncbi:MAG: hypothetical protein EA398_16205 [Deltaproteobacteria bacterium]|nr:MAG: hypothetical protein EA398_16205 [Deltaproteobacteria bacterium]
MSRRPPLPRPRVGDRATRRGDDGGAWTVYRVWRSAMRSPVTIELARDGEQESVHVTQFFAEWDMEG